MMKSIFFGVVALMFAALVMHQEQASAQTPNQKSKVPESTDWNFMDTDCSSQLQTQINAEFNASLFYLQYAAYFARYDVNLPGFEKFFFNAASEEREHGIKLIEYALMRGQKPIHIPSFNLDFEMPSNLLKSNPNEVVGLSALEAALEKEQSVTLSIRQLIKACENNQNDYHLVDYLTGEFLEEQHQGQRDIAGKIEMLKKMLKTNGKLGEFIYDRQNM